MTKINKSELDWRAEDDARVLAQYQEILLDKARLSRAKKAATKEVTNLSNRLQIMKKVSATKSASKKGVK